MDTSIFKSYDIRGVYPEQLTGELAYAVGHAAAKVLGGGRIAVGRDMRVSSEHLASELIRGLTDAGVDVLDIGLVSTDTVYFVTGRDSIPGIMITASHNPAQYGGIKFCRAGAVAVSQETGLHEIQQLVEQAYRHPASAKGNSTSVDIIGE
jgi:phosphomannomutase